jgi:hypothetical protein
MDINNYSYTPTILDNNNTIKYYNSDDMYAEIIKERSYDKYIFFIYACSYDGQLEISEQTENENKAIELYNYIVDNYADTPPNELNNDILTILQ